jgi:hypothetical protein
MGGGAPPTPAFSPRAHRRVVASGLGHQDLSPYQYLPRTNHVTATPIGAIPPIAGSSPPRGLPLPMSPRPSLRADHTNGSGPRPLPWGSQAPWGRRGWVAGLGAPAQLGGTRGPLGHQERSPARSGGSSRILHYTQSAARSRHSGFAAPINHSFFFRDHFLICFSRAMAARMSLVVSKHTSFVQLYRRVKAYSWIPLRCSRIRCGRSDVTPTYSTVWWAFVRMYTAQTAPGCMG